jgi:hypothetical protein
VLVWIHCHSFQCIQSPGKKEAVLNGAELVLDVKQIGFLMHHGLCHLLPESSLTLQIQAEYVMASNSCRWRSHVCAMFLAKFFHLLEEKILAHFELANEGVLED